MAQTLGIDVSIWQDDNSTPQQMNFNMAREAGAKFVFIKASEDTWIDEDMLYNWKAAKAAGLLRGAYHMMTWNTAPDVQARYFAGLLKNDRGEMPPVLDFEKRINVPDRDRAAWAARVFLETLQREMNVMPILYTSPSYWKEYGTGDVYWTRYPLWIANYDTTAPAVPKPWETWKFWQWGTPAWGAKFGAESGDIDADFYNGTLEQLHGEYGHPVVPIPPQTIEGMKMYVAVDALNIRRGPGVSYAVVGRLQKGDVVTVTDVRGSSAWVEIGPGKWCAADYAGVQYLKGIL